MLSHPAFSRRLSFLLSLVKSMAADGVQIPGISLLSSRGGSAPIINATPLEARLLSPPFLLPAATFCRLPENREKPFVKEDGVMFGLTDRKTTTTRSQRVRAAARFAAACEETLSGSAAVAKVQTDAAAVLSSMGLTQTRISQIQSDQQAVE
jgi:hypothetical protein